MKVLTLHEKIRLLRDHGFQPQRITTHGELWRKGKRTMMVARRPKKDDHRASKNWLAMFRHVVAEEES